MKVLFILGRIPVRADTDGISRWFFNTIKPMFNLVDKVDVAGQIIEPLEMFYEVKKYCHQFFFVPLVDHTKYRYKWFLGWDYAKIRVYNTNFVQLIQKVCHINQYDLIILVGHGTHVYIPYIKAKHIMAAPLDAPSGIISCKTKNILTYCKGKLNNVAVHYSEKSYNAADSVLVVSENDRNLLIKSDVKTKIIINPLSVDTTEFFPYKSEGSKLFIIFTGVLSFEPNIDAVMHLVKDIFIKGEFSNQEIICRIAGRNPTQRIKELKLTKGVEIHENLPDLRPLINDAFVYVSPMRIGLGMKNKILEAMAMGKAIVGYPLTFNGIKDPEQFAFVCHSPQEIIESINALSHDISLRNRFGTRAREFALEYYSLDRSAEYLINQV